MKPRIYLSGAIYGTTDNDQEWRTIINKKLNKWYEIIDPLKRDYRKTKFNYVNSRDIVLGDLKDLDHSHVIIANCEKPGWGTAMEIFYGHMKGKPILFFTSNKNPSPWLLSHARNVHTIDNAINKLKKFRKTIIECGI
jgi:nucleoside 2-deoxyribosyltransferase